VISEARKRGNNSYFKVSKPYKGIMANNKKGIRELSKNKSKHIFKNRLHDSYKPTVHINLMIFCRECG
jgi:hypothetical protein